MAYRIKNISSGMIYEDLDTKGPDGRRENLSIKPRASAVLTEAQWNSRAVQKHILKGRLRSTPA